MTKQLILALLPNYFVKKLLGGGCNWNATKRAELHTYNKKKPFSIINKQGQKERGVEKWQMERFGSKRMSRMEATNFPRIDNVRIGLTKYLLGMCCGRFYIVRRLCETKK